jgi:hypothetical protein
VICYRIGNAALLGFGKSPVRAANELKPATQNRACREGRENERTALRVNLDADFCSAIRQVRHWCDVCFWHADLKQRPLS